MEFADRIKLLLKNSHSTVNQMAKDLGLGMGTFNAWVKNGRIPRGDIVLKISQYFHVSTDYLLTGVEPSGNHLRQDEIRLLEYYNRLSDLEKGEILGQLKEKDSSRENKGADAI